MNPPNEVRVGVTPFWRWAVGPTSNMSPAVPFWTRKAAEEFLREVVQETELPAILYKRKGWRGIQQVLTLRPKP